MLDNRVGTEPTRARDGWSSNLVKDSWHRNKGCEEGAIGMLQTPGLILGCVGKHRGSLAPCLGFSPVPSLPLLLKSACSLLRCVRRCCWVTKQKKSLSFESGTFFLQEIWHWTSIFNYAAVVFIFLWPKWVSVYSGNNLYSVLFPHQKVIFRWHMSHNP